MNARPEWNMATEAHPGDQLLQAIGSLEALSKARADFIAECAQLGGRLVDGNRIAERARALQAGQFAAASRIELTALS